MERLLTRTETDTHIIYTAGHTRFRFDKRDASMLQRVFDLAYAYEETGLEPDQIGGMVQAFWDPRTGMTYKDATELQAYRTLGPVEELSALVKVQDEGLVATWPAELWAVKPNPSSNEWNDEPEHHIVHYIVHAFEPETERYFVNTDNYPGLKQRHWIKGKGLYKTRAEAEAAIGGGGDG